MAMEVRVRDVKRWAGRRIEVPLEGEWPAPLQERSDWPLEGAACGRVTVDNGGEFLAVVLRGRATLRAECGRCLGPMRLEVPFELHQEFREAEPGLADEWLPYRQDVIPLDELVAEAVVLATPAVPVCDPECRGLCSQCGRDLNDGECGCLPPADERWRALAGWRRPQASENPEEDT